MSDYNRQQYNLMISLLKNFRKDPFALRKLIVDLEALVRCLPDAEKLRKHAIWEKIGDLEQVNAVMLDRSENDFDETAEKIIDETIKELIDLVQEAGKQGLQTWPSA